MSLSSVLSSGAENGVQNWTFLHQFSPTNTFIGSSSRLTYLVIYTVKRVDGFENRSRGGGVFSIADTGTKKSVLFRVSRSTLCKNAIAKCPPGLLGTGSFRSEYFEKHDFLYDFLAFCTYFLEQSTLRNTIFCVVPMSGIRAFCTHFFEQSTSRNTIFI